MHPILAKILTSEDVLVSDFVDLMAIPRGDIPDLDSTTIQNEIWRIFADCQAKEAKTRTRLIKAGERLFRNKNLYEDSSRHISNPEASTGEPVAALPVDLDEERRVVPVIENGIGSTTTRPSLTAFGTLDLPTLNSLQITGAGEEVFSAIDISGTVQELDGERRLVTFNGNLFDPSHTQSHAEVGPIELPTIGSVQITGEEEEAFPAIVMPDLPSHLGFNEMFDAVHGAAVAQEQEPSDPVVDSGVEVTVPQVPGVPNRSQSEGDATGATSYVPLRLATSLNNRQARTSTPPAVPLTPREEELASLTLLPNNNNNRRRGQKRKPVNQQLRLLSYSQYIPRPAKAESLRKLLEVPSTPPLPVFDFLVQQLRAKSDEWKDRVGRVMWAMRTSGGGVEEQSPEVVPGMEEPMEIPIGVQVEPENIPVIIPEDRKPPMDNLIKSEDGEGTSPEVIPVMEERSTVGQMIPEMSKDNPMEGTSAVIPDATIPSMDNWTIPGPQLSQVVAQKTIEFPVPESPPETEQIIIPLQRPLSNEEVPETPDEELPPVLPSLRVSCSTPITSHHPTMMQDFSRNDRSDISVAREQEKSGQDIPSMAVSSMTVQGLNSFLAENIMMVKPTEEKIQFVRKLYLEVQASGRILFREVMARNSDRMAVAWQFGLLIEFNNHLWHMETDDEDSGLASTQPKWICKLMG